MYTVLIFSKESMKDFLPYKPLFAECVNSGLMGICEWTEDAYTIESAVPDLYRMISDKPEWRAMIVSTKPSPFDEAYSADTINPFDYKTKYSLKRVAGDVVDEGAPLIKLTHLLTGSIPQVKAPLDYQLDYPDSQYEEEENDYSIPSFRYTEVKMRDQEIAELQEQELMRQEWTLKHQFKAVSPEQIQIIKTRPSFGDNEVFQTISASWHVYTEFDSSEFWKRNRYPQNCRFMVYDIGNNGTVQEQNDLFRFWCCVGLIAENEIDPNVIQAHRLYRLSCSINSQTMADYIQNSVNNLNRMHYTLEKKIIRERAMIAAGVNGIPDYKENLILDYEPENNAAYYVNPDYIQLSGDMEDIRLWRQYNESFYEGARSLSKNLTRSVDRTIDKTRYKREYLNDEVYQVPKDTEEDIKESLSDLRSQIYTVQKEMPVNLSTVDPDLDELNQIIEDHMRSRMNSSMVRGIMILICLAVIILVLPSVILQEVTWRIVVVLVFFLLGSALALLCVLVIDRNHLLAEMKDAEMIVLHTISDLSERADNLINYLSMMASHVHGASFLRIMNNEKLTVDSSLYAKQRKLKEIDAFKSLLAKWNTALQLGLDMNCIVTDILPGNSNEDDENRTITLAHDEQIYNVRLSDTGTSIKTHYPFIQKLLIERIALYDDPDEFDILGNRTSAAGEEAENE